ncbi:DUF2062 domain-containing protein [Pararhizobium gei]|uniref:DUF2062 domain-containing protein n=1 Tax=Pararhizobium gei TaxID=1395951 RepID=UPI0023D980DC|nr:DUF2062 domain-containing protein [Rhizobium gei]
MRVMRLSASPHAIATGVAAGAASSATPFIGFHIVIALALAYLLSGNLVAAGIATALANPLTIPLILTAIYEVGTAILGVHDSAGLSGDKILGMLRHLELAELWQPLLKPMLIGALPVSLASAVIFYIAAFWAARLFQSRRRSLVRESRAGHISTERK